MESLVSCGPASSVDSEAGGSFVVPGGIALQRLNGGGSTEVADNTRPPAVPPGPRRMATNSQQVRGGGVPVQSTSICPSAVHVVTGYCSRVTTSDAVLDARGSYSNSR